MRWPLAPPSPLSSDAHTVAELDYVHNAVPTGRRGWATPSDVLNAGGLTPSSPAAPTTFPAGQLKGEPG